MTLNPEICNFVITLYEKDMPVRHDYHETMGDLVTRVEAFKRSGKYYRIWSGKCETVDPDDWIEINDWLNEPPKIKKRGRS